MISTSGHLISKFPEVRFHRTRIFKYSKGYLDAMVNAQANIDGHFFLEDFLNPSLIAAMEKVYPITPNSDGAETPAYIYSQYFLGRRATAISRQNV